MQKYLALTVIVFLMQSNALAAESFEGWTEDKVTVHCGAMAILNRYMNKSVDGQLPPMSEDQQYWWDKTKALLPDAATLRREVTLAGQSFEADYLRASNNETNPKVTRKSHAGGLDLSCALYRVNKRIAEGEKALAQLDRDLVVANEISRREKAEASISFDEPPFVNIRKNESAATLDIYFSLGCNHCLLFLDQHLDDLIRLKSEGRLNLRFLEIPGLTSYLIGSVGRGGTIAARARAKVASRYAACAAMKGPHRFTNFITRLIVSAKSYIPNIDSESWEYYAHAVDSDFRASSPFRSVEAMLEHAGDQFKISIEQCDETFIEERSEETFAIIKTLAGKVTVPFYRFDGRYYNGSDDQEQLMTDVQKYVDSMPVVSP